MKASSPRPGSWLLLAFLIITAAVYWPGLFGGFLFDDYPNIVDNQGVQPHEASLATLVNAALSSPASEFKRPLASLSFAVNYLVSGLDPYAMKLTNLVIHLLNGLLTFLLARALLQIAFLRKAQPIVGISEESARTSIVAALIAGGWMLLPINLTGVLYVVQRMESLANLFVLLGLIGYLTGRRRMLGLIPATGSDACPKARVSSDIGSLLLCAASITLPLCVGILAKETAVMLPLYALLVEWILFDFGRQQPDESLLPVSDDWNTSPDRRILGLFLLVLVVPMVIGVAWLLPGILRAETWATRDFNLVTRLLSEARIIASYIDWSLLPTPDTLSFYHDNFQISQGLLTPWTTLASIVFLGVLIALMLWLRRRLPLAALGIALFLSCQLLTGTILPLELIYEHRNYFASFGLLLAIVPLLAAQSKTTDKITLTVPMALPRYALLAGLMFCWAALTALTAYAWGNPLRLAQDLASRAPQSPRALYELGRTYIIYSHYDPSSAFTQSAYAPLERSAALPDSSILPEQALIFMNSRMNLPIKEAWWDSMIAKLKRHKPGVQDESSLGALTQCAHEHRCTLRTDRMTQAFMAALSHPNPSARLLATYGDYAWNVLDDRTLGLRMTKEAVNTQPNEPAYQITLIRMLAAQGEKLEAKAAIKQLETLNIGGRLDGSLRGLRALPGLQ
jgi:protein O-mannosyl-transferase